MKITVIGVAGPSGSGKTTIAREIHTHYKEENCLTISSDNYYKDLSHLTFEERQAIYFDHPDSIDFELLAVHIARLTQEQSVAIPTYDFSTHSRTERTLLVHPKPILIIEGILVHHPAYLARLYHIKIFVDTDPDICFIRRLERDVSERGRTMAQVITQYKRDVKPMYEQFVLPCRDRAEIIIENSSDTIATPAGVQFDIHPLITHLDSETRSSGQARFRLFAHSFEPLQPTITAPMPSYEHLHTLLSQECMSTSLNALD